MFRSKMFNLSVIYLFHCLPLNVAPSACLRNLNPETRALVLSPYSIVRVSHPSRPPHTAMTVYKHQLKVPDQLPRMYETYLNETIILPNDSMEHTP